MNDDFMRRLAPRVAGCLPLIEGESLDDYCSRVRLKLSADQRALIGAHLLAVSDDLKAERQIRKAAWISAARLTFVSGQRLPCVICGKYEGLTEAHHTVPLAVQFNAGATEAIQEFDWLCPTHHAAQHVFISNLLAKVASDIPGLPSDESTALHRLNAKMVDLFLMLPAWESVTR